MRTAGPLLGRRTTLVWAALVAATALSWWLGPGHGLLLPTRVAAGVVLLVAWVKVWFVGAEFMELRAAPWLRRGVATWLTVVGATTVVLAILV